MEEFLSDEKQMKRKSVNKIGQKKSSRIKYRKAKLWKYKEEIESQKTELEN